MPQDRESGAHPPRVGQLSEPERERRRCARAQRHIDGLHRGKPQVVGQLAAGGDKPQTRCESRRRLERGSKLSRSAPRRRIRPLNGPLQLGQHVIPRLTVLRGVECHLEREPLDGEGRRPSVSDDDRLRALRERRPQRVVVHAHPGQRPVEVEGQPRLHAGAMRRRVRATMRACPARPWSARSPARKGPAPRPDGPRAGPRGQSLHRAEALLRRRASAR